MKKYFILLLPVTIICLSSCKKTINGGGQNNQNTSKAYTTTYSGDSTAGFVNGYVKLARFNGPFGIGSKRLGFVFVADQGNNCIRMIQTVLGEVSTYAGTGVGGFLDGSSAAAQFNRPSGVAVDSLDNVYVADVDNECIRMITTARVVSTIAGIPLQEGYRDGSAGTAEFAQPTGIAVGVGGIYIAEAANNCIRKIANGVVSTLAGNPNLRGFADGRGQAALFNNPQGVAVDGQGNVYVADVSNNRIRKISSTGDVTTLAGDSTEGYADGTGSNARFAGPTGVTLDMMGNIFVADAVGESIRMITPAGVVTTVAGTPLFQGSADGIGLNASFANPTGVVFDATGLLYVADFVNNRIRKIMF